MILKGLEDIQRRQEENQRRLEALQLRQEEAERRQVGALNAIARDIREPHGLSTQLRIAAMVGKATYETLDSEGRVFLATQSMSGELDPIASEEELNLWLSCNSKTELVTIAAPALRRIRQLPSIWDPCGLVLVSSGSSHWLDSLHVPSHDSQLKTPDFYVAWGQCIKGHLKNGELSGVLAGRALQLDGCVREFFEARVGDGALTMEDFGQLVDYHGSVRRV